MRHRETGTEYESLVRHNTETRRPVPGVQPRHNNTLETSQQIQSRGCLLLLTQGSFNILTNSMSMLCQMNLLIVNITSSSRWFEPLTLSALFSLVCYPRLVSIPILLTRQKQLKLSPGPRLWATSKYIQQHLKLSGNNSTSISLGRSLSSSPSDSGV